MKIVEPSATILHPDPLDEHLILQQIEQYGRTAYKSEDRITSDSAVTFVKKLIISGHESVLEHINITVRFVCDRGVSHELVRHRIAAYTQESTRWVNYQKRGVEVIKPLFWKEDSIQWAAWVNAMVLSEFAYNHLLELGASPQQARSVLPNSLKTEIVATMNVRQWRHVLRQRTATGVHPQMREVMGLLLEQLQATLPTLFMDILLGV